MVRLSIGIEHIDDIPSHDIEAGLGGCKIPRRANKTQSQRFCFTRRKIRRKKPSGSIGWLFVF